MMRPTASARLGSTVSAISSEINLPSLPECCHHDGFHGSHGKGTHIAAYIIWCAIGAGLGWVAGAMVGKSDFTARIEELLVGMFGAYAGGELLMTHLRVAGTADTFNMLSLLTAAVGGVAILVLLVLFRRLTGPMRPSRSRSKQRN